VEGQRNSWWSALLGRAPRSQAALDDYDESTLIIWLPVSFVYVAVIILQFWGRESYQVWLGYFDWAMSALFLADYVIRIRIAPDRRAFALKLWNIMDLVVIAAPVIGLFTGQVGAGILRVFRIYRLLSIAKRVWDRGGHSLLEAGQVKWVGVIAGACVFLATLAVWAQESIHADSAIHNPLDAVWWSFVTMFTVGYGDTYPHTWVGKGGALVVMFAGIALFSWATGALASKFVESESEAEAKRERTRMRQQLDDMTQQLGRMEHALAALSNGKDGASDEAHVQEDAGGTVVVPSGDGAAP
jgi:voltage-gated potassium channel